MPVPEPGLTTTGAVVIGGDYHALGVVRSLGARGVPVCVIDDEPSVSRFSRYAARSLVVGDLRRNGRTVEALLEAGAAYGMEGWVVFPTRDEAVKAVSRGRDALAEMYRVPTAGWEVMRWACDKRATHELADRVGVRTPRSWVIGPDDIDQVDTPPPWVIKPALRTRFLAVTGVKAFRADTREELAVLLRRATEIDGAGTVMVQELIPGDGNEQVAWCGLVKEGRVLASVETRRLRQRPPDFGRSSTYVETDDIPELEELSMRLLSEIDYYGLVELEYKRDPRDGSYRLLDFNARTWGYHSIGAAAGVDFPYLLFADQVGDELEPVRGRKGVTWARLVTDVPTAVGAVLRGELGLWKWLRQMRSLDIEASLVRG